jgi:cytochrome c peroxidase
MRNYILTFVFATLITLVACKKQPVEVNNVFDTHHADVSKVLNLPYQVGDYNNWEMPKYLTTIGLKKPVVDDKQVTLGRVLFYDKGLSVDGKISCASCHNPAVAFSDTKKLSEGVNGRTTQRNSPPLANVINVAAHYKGWTRNLSPFFWDSRAGSIADQSRETIENPDEMGMPLSQLVKNVSEKTYYQVLFKNAYGDQVINEERVLACLEQFVEAIPANRSRFDRAMDQAGVSSLIIDSVTTDPRVLIFSSYYNQDTTYVPGGTTVTLRLPLLNDWERQGGAIFVSNCSNCHSPIRPFQKVFAANIGLDMNYADQGLGVLTGAPADQGVFKAPPLRNIALTGPYMHDGRFAKLEDVIEHYNTGIRAHPNLHPLLKGADGKPTRLNLSMQQKSALLAFLMTLTDNSAGIDAKFSNPFK